MGVRLLLAAVLVIAGCSSAPAKVQEVTRAAEAAWLRHLLPMPHVISIRQQRSMAPAAIGIRLNADAGAAERQAAEEIVTLLRERTGIEPNGNEFEIFLGVAAPDGRIGDVPLDRLARLREAPNAAQAYLIQPVGENRLVLAGLTERGVYYAAQTLRQLLAASAAPDTVRIPMAEVMDWPDFEERGAWNYPLDWTSALAGAKLNFGKPGVRFLNPLVRDQPATVVAANVEQCLAARKYAFHILPGVAHLNFLGRYNLFVLHPELAGVGDGALAGRYFAHKGGDQHRVPCASNPLLTRLLAEWLAGFATLGVAEAGCWLTERPAQCGCKDCAAVGQFTLEARACVNAWREVRKQYPDFRIRLFLSTTTTVDNCRVLAETPPEVKIERACATGMERVRRFPRDIFRNPLLDSYAAEGRWLATYDVPVNVNGAVDTPEFKLPHSSAERVRDFLRQMSARGYRGTYAMMAWHQFLPVTCGYNVDALAEWSWNLNGRSEREFALSYATRNGYENPEAFADWAAIMGPIEFDVYDSDFPTCYSWGKAAAMVIERRRPRLGEGMFRYYKDADDFDLKIAACERALALARTFKHQQPAHETAIVLSYVRLAKAVYGIAEIASTDDLRSPESQKRLRVLLGDVKNAGSENARVIREWRASLGPEPWHHRVHDAVKATEQTVKEIEQRVRGAWLY